MLWCERCADCQTVIIISSACNGICKLPGHVKPTPKPRRDVITSKRKDVSANQKSGEKRNWHVTNPTTTAQREEGESCVRADNEIKSLLDITLEYKVDKTPPSAI